MMCFWIGVVILVLYIAPGVLLAKYFLSLELQRRALFKKQGSMGGGGV